MTPKWRIVHKRQDQAAGDRWPFQVQVRYPGEEWTVMALERTYPAAEASLMRLAQLALTDAVH